MAAPFSTHLTRQVVIAATVTRQFGVVPINRFLLALYRDYRRWRDRKAADDAEVENLTQ